MVLVVGFQAKKALLCRKPAKRARPLPSSWAGHVYVCHWKFDVASIGFEGSNTD